jgi:hypothetical protein
VRAEYPNHLDYDGFVTTVVLRPVNFLSIGGKSLVAPPE